MTTATDPAALASTAPAGHNSPPQGASRVCYWCMEAFEAPATGPGQHKRFCCEGHRKAFNNLNSVQGGPLVPLLKAWRVARSSSKNREIGSAALTELVSIVDLLIAEDRKAGRTTESILGYARDQLKGGARYLDRSRRC